MRIVVVTGGSRVIATLLPEDSEWINAQSVEVEVGGGYNI